MKKKYMPAELEFVLFGSLDVIATSGGTVQPPEQENPDEENKTGSGVGNDYNQDGWMGI